MNKINNLTNTLPEGIRIFWNGECICAESVPDYWTDEACLEEARSLALPIINQYLHEAFKRIN